VTDGDEPAKTGRTILTVIAMLVIGMVLPLAGLMIAWKTCGHTAMQGRVDVAGSKLGTWRAPLSRCIATAGNFAPGSGEVLLGQREDDGPMVRFVLDALDGAVVTVWPLSGDRTLELRSTTCPALRAELRRINGADAAQPRYDGRLSGTCPLGDGGKVTLEVWFRGCGG
jgi:hypothetical protein